MEFVRSDPSMLRGFIIKLHDSGGAACNESHTEHRHRIVRADESKAAKIVQPPDLQADLFLNPASRNAFCDAGATVAGTRRRKILAELESFAHDLPAIGIRWLTVA